MQRIAVFVKQNNECKNAFFEDEINGLSDFNPLIFTDTDFISEKSDFDIHVIVSRKSSVLEVASKYFFIEPRKDNDVVNKLKSSDISVIKAWGGNSVKDAWFYAGLLNLPMIIRIIDEDDLEILKKIVSNKNEIIDFTSLIITSSHIMKWELAELGFSEEKIHILPHVLKTNGSSGDLIPEVPGIVIQNSLTDADRFFYLFYALNILKQSGYDFKITLLNPLSAKGDYNKWIAEFSLGNITSIISCSKDAQFDKIKQATAVLVPSLRKDSGLCILRSGMEASALGVPVITENKDVFASVIENDSTGYIINEKDVESVSEHLAYLFRNPGICTKMGIAAKAKMEFEFSSFKYASEFSKLLDIIN